MHLKVVMDTWPTPSAFPLRFVFAPALKTSPELSRTYQLSSLADLVAFRYQSPWAGTVATIVILVGVTPLLALQIRAVADTANLLTEESSESRGRRLLRPDHLIRDSIRRPAVPVAPATMVWSWLSPSNLSPNLRHLAVGVFAVYGAFGGLDGVDWATVDRIWFRD